MIALFCSVLFRKTSTSLMTTYLLIVVLFCAPLAAIFFARTVYPDQQIVPIRRSGLGHQPVRGGVLRAARHGACLDEDETCAGIHGWRRFGGYVLFTGLLNALLLVLMVWLFNTRWRVAD